jgi:hypothetical protein
MLLVLCIYIHFQNPKEANMIHQFASNLGSGGKGKSFVKKEDPKPKK